MTMMIIDTDHETRYQNWNFISLQLFNILSEFAKIMASYKVFWPWCDDGFNYGIF